MIGELIRKMRRKGFVGPYYSGIGGTARFVIESVIARNEFLFVATPESVAAVPAPPDAGLVLHRIRTHTEFDPYVSEFDAAYYRGYTSKWKAPFTWGEQAVVGTIDGRLACYNWLQEGTRDGFPTYYSRMFADEARVLRGGVLPAFRSGGLNAAMKHALLRSFFAAGIERVYGEVYQYNTPSIRSLLRIGFKPFGMITVIEAWPFTRFIRWRSQGELDAQLERIGVTRPAAGVTSP